MNKIQLTSITALLSSSSAFSAVLVQFNTGTDANTLVATTTETGFASTNLAITGTTDTGWQASNSNIGGFNNGLFIRTTTAASVDDGISFTITNNSGTDYNLTSFSFFTAGQAANNLADAYQYTLQPQVDGINVGTAHTAVITGNTGSTANATVTAPLSQVLADGASATFSIDSFSSNTPAGTDGVAEVFELFRAGGFSVEGVAIPEPSAALLGGLGLLGLLRRRR